MNGSKADGRRKIVMDESVFWDKFTSVDAVVLHSTLGDTCKRCRR